MLARFAEAGAPRAAHLPARRPEGRSRRPRADPADTPNADLMNEFLREQDGQTFQSIPVVFYTRDLDYLYHFVERPAIYRPERLSGALRVPRPGETPEQTWARFMAEWAAVQRSPFFKVWAGAAIDEMLSALCEISVLGPPRGCHPPGRGQSRADGSPRRPPRHPAHSERRPAPRDGAPPATWRYRSETRRPAAQHFLAALAALSRQTNFSVALLLRGRAALPSLAAPRAPDRARRAGRLSLPPGAAPQPDPWALAATRRGPRPRAGDPSHHRDWPNPDAGASAIGWHAVCTTLPTNTSSHRREVPCAGVIG
jgi:hypothetical protein